MKYMSSLFNKTEHFNMVHLKVYLLNKHEWCFY
jgi:hypothetical protein